MHTLSGDVDFVYYLFHNESADKRIEGSTGSATEGMILDRMWHDFNVMIRFFHG